MSNSGFKPLALGLVIGLIIGVLGVYLLTDYALLGTQNRMDRTIYTEPENIVLSFQVKDNVQNMNFPDVGKLVVNEDSGIMVSLGGVEYEPSQLEKIAMSAVVTLTSDGKTYEISAPCLFYTSSCVYPESVRLGYNVPLVVEKGVYDISVILTWATNSDGDFKIQINIDEV